MFRVENLIEDSEPEDNEDFGLEFDRRYKVWDNQPGGHIVERWQEDGVEYVGVEFEGSPGQIYTYRAKG